MPAVSDDGAAVTAEGLSLRGPRGWVYRDVGLTAGPGALVAVEGPAGSGRTSLLLTLAGRMRPTSGHAAVDGLPLPGKAARVRKIAALGHVPGVTDLDEALTVAEHLREQWLLHAFPGGRSRHRRTPDEALALAGLDLGRLPAGSRTPVRELDALAALRLATALALLGRPRLLCVDDTDDRLHSGDRAAAWRMLHEVAASGSTVLASTTDAGAAAGLPALTVRLRPHAADSPASEDAEDANDGALNETSDLPEKADDARS